MSDIPRGAIASPAETERFGFSVGRLEYSEDTDWAAVNIAADIAASDVDLPLPVVPVTRISPRFSIESCSRIGGSPSSRIVRIFIGMTRSTAPMVPRCW